MMLARRERSSSSAGSFPPRRIWLPKANVYDAAGGIGTLTVVFMFLVPIGVVLSLSFSSADNYTALLSDEIFKRSFFATLRMAAVVAIICVLIGWPYAYVMARAPKALALILLMAVMMSFWTSMLVRTYAWQILLNDTGMINTLLLDLGLITEPIRMIRTDFAVYLGMAHVLAPFAILPIYAQLQSVSPELERAAQSMGALRTSAFWQIVVPLSAPGAIAGLVLVFVTSLGFYITPQILGGPGQLYIGSAIVQKLNLTLDIGAAAAMAVVLLVAILFVFVFASRVIRVGQILGVRNQGGEK